MSLLYLHLLSFTTSSQLFFFFFFFNDTATTEIYTLSLHDALPISEGFFKGTAYGDTVRRELLGAYAATAIRGSEQLTPRSEEHTSELQSPCNLVCRLLLEKKKKIREKKVSEYEESNTCVRVTH